LAPDFSDLFDRPADTLASAPGRVNLLGEHTDYNDGFVLPAAIPQRTTIELARRDDDLVRVYSAERPGPIQTYRLGEEARKGLWIDYIQGVTQALAVAGHAHGFDARISSEVPLGSGLSSSAALEVALLRGLRTAYSLPIDDVTLALLAHRGETGLVGAPVGVMDPFACHFADERTALLLDTRSLELERIPLPPGLALIVVYSGVDHRLAAGGGYRTRRAECERAAALLGVPKLRDLDPAAGPRIAALPAPLDRRVRHVVAENARVLQAVDALWARDLLRLGALFHASHRSMRDDYEVSTPEIDTLVDLARAEPGIFGARLTGGGFGGSVVMLASPDEAAALAARIARRYHQATGRSPRVLVPR
jgi:galactokinase